MTDVHAHLLPGLDDGPETTEEALTLIKNLNELGYKRLVATPHIMVDLYPNTTDIILQTYRVFKQELEKHKIAIEFFCAAEYFMDEAFERHIEQDDLLALFEKYVLIEMSTLAIFPRCHEYIFKLKTKGYIPILAHPERYTYFHREFERFENLKNMGCLFQANILSFQGYYGKKIKSVAFKLLEKNMIDLLGSDTHHQQHIKHLQKAFRQKKLNQILSQYNFKNDKL